MVQNGPFRSWRGPFRSANRTLLAIPDLQHGGAHAGWPRAWQTDSQDKWSKVTAPSGVLAEELYDKQKNKN